MRRNLKIMKQYIILLFALTGALYSQAQGSSEQPAAQQGVPHKYEIINNGEVITITDKSIGKTYTYSAYDTLHYAVIRKIRAEKEAAKKQQPSDRERKREEIIR